MNAITIIKIIIAAVVGALAATVVLKLFGWEYAGSVGGGVGGALGAIVAMNSGKKDNAPASD